jgi:hypothetical protein
MSAVDGALRQPHSLRCARLQIPHSNIASEEGERLLAGYLLRQSADRINCKASGNAAEIQLHYDH